MPPQRRTLLELIRAVQEVAGSDAEVVRIVAYLVNAGSVVLCGTFAGQRIPPMLPGSGTTADPEF